MARGIINIIMGGIMIIGGLGGDLVLKGTESGGALALLGAALCGFGIYRIASVKPTQRTL